MKIFGFVATWAMIVILALDAIRQHYRALRGLGWERLQAVKVLAVLGFLLALVVLYGVFVIYLLTFEGLV